jgi:hypothetical protein
MSGSAARRAASRGEALASSVELTPIYVVNSTLDGNRRPIAVLPLGAPFFDLPETTR